MEVQPPIHDTPNRQGAQLVRVSDEYSKLLLEAESLSRKSKYKSSFNYSVYRKLEMRSEKKPIRGGIIYKSPLKLVGAHSTCQQCLYTLELDTYGRGCFHDCIYCYAKAQLVQHSFWNRPIPVPININQIWKLFYTVFETDRPNKWREILEKRIPIRIGSMSDSFMWIDSKFRVTFELLKILKFYKYPYIVFTRSDLIAYDDYMEMIPPELASVQLSLSSTNSDFTKLIEPGAPSPKRRLKAAKKLQDAGIWTTIRLNPFFPIYPDGYYTDPNFKQTTNTPQFPFSSFEMIDEIADYNIESVLAGFVRLSPYSINQIKKSTGYDLKDFFTKGKIVEGSRDFHYSDSEISYYYKELSNRSKKHGIDFSTCYIGYGEHRFWEDRKLWSNKIDCCNAQKRVPSFKTDCRTIPFDKRVRLSPWKEATKSSSRLHETLQNS